MKGKNYRPGVISQGVRTPIIQPGDDLQEIVISCVAEANDGKFDDGDIISVTEAVVAISQENFVSYEDIAKDIMRKFPGAKELVLVNPIQSRNRFEHVLKAIASTPTLEKVYIVMTYPTDEVGNRLVSELDMMESGVNPYTEIFTVEEFYEKFGKPSHKFTGVNYIERYIEVCKDKIQIILGNNFSKIPSLTKCDDFLVCTIHEPDRTMTRMMLERGGAKHILDLSQIMNESIDGSNFNEEHGLYGTNARADGKLKLMPRNSQVFVKEIQDKILDRYGKHVEVLVYGDGAFKDPVGGIWELADPEASLGATKRLEGTPKEVKLKYLASAHEGKSPEEIEEIIAEERRKRKNTDELSGEASTGTTPRRITDLLASLSDLTTGSGDRQTPVVYIKNYLE